MRISVRSNRGDRSTSPTPPIFKGRPRRSERQPVKKPGPLLWSSDPFAARRDSGVVRDEGGEGEDPPSFPREKKTINKKRKLCSERRSTSRRCGLASPLTSCEPLGSVPEC